jgi:carboxypeptidase family protein
MKRLTLLVGVILLFLSIPAWAQDTATIVGAVTDATGAVIPGAKVTVTNPLKGYTRQLIASSAGEYTAYKVPIGDYVVTAEAPGFQKLVRSGITLSVGQTLRVDLQMTLGQVTQEVTVTGNVARVETETAAISDVVTGQQISNMMMNGRNFVTLATLVPGAVPDNGLDTSHVGVYGNNSISFNGSRTQYNNWEIDGGNNTDEGSAGTFNTYPNIDTIAEFRISTSNYGADMGKHAGATIEVATKSGTRDFHGDAFEYVRNDKFDSNDWFVNRQINPPGGNAPKRPLKWNDYGYTLGGPVYIPGHYNTSKSKTFFYWSEDWRSYREGQVVSSGVPSLRMRNGDLTECDKSSPNFNSVAASGCTLPTLNGVTYNNIANIPGVTPQSITNSNALLNGLIPKPNNGVTGWVLSSSTATDWRQEQIRVDQNISDKTQVFARYTQDAWNTLAVPALWTWSNYDTVKTPFGGPGKSAVFHITHSFKPNLMNEFIMGYTVDHILLFPAAGSDSAGINRQAGGFVANHFFPANDGNKLLPSIVVCGGTPFCAAQDTGFYPWFNSNPIITWKDNIAYTVGRHTVKFGAFLEKYRKNEQYGAETQGSMHFDNWGSNTSGNALADMFLGRIEQYQEGTETANGIPVGGYPKGHWRMTAFEPYIQDDFRVNHKLTLNLGLRYYYFTRIHDVTRPTIDSGFLPNQFNPTKEAQLDSNGNLVQSLGSHLYTAFGNGLVECGVNGIAPGCQLNNDGPNWAPRFGFAYDPWGTGKTVIRGGYGVYFEMGNGNEAQAEGGEGNPPIALSPSNFNVTGYQNIQPVYVNGTYAAPLGPTGYTSWPYNQKWGSEQQFNLGMQHEFSGNNLLTLAYVGTLGRHLARNRNISQIPIGVGTMNVPALANANQYCDAQGNCDVQNVLINQLEPTTFFQRFRGYNNIGQKENTAVSSYHSLQANFRHAFGHGLTLQTVYTWSHAIDDSSSTYFQSGVNDYDLKRWRDTSDLNRTQVLTTNYIYELPFFKSSSSSVLRQALGGWSISGITSFFTGQPVDFGCGVAGFGTGIGQSVRCNSLGPVKIAKHIDVDPQFGPTPAWFLPQNVAQPFQAQLRADGEPGMFGYQGRNFLTGPGRNNTDLALLKDFSTPWFRGEHSKLQFRLETFNTFNHPQWQFINAGCNGDANANGSPAFGRNCAGNEHNLGNGQVNSAWPSRIMQLGLKFIF